MRRSVLLVVAVAGIAGCSGGDLASLEARLNEARTADEVSSAVKQLVGRKGDVGRDLVRDYAEGNGSVVFFPEHDLLFQYLPREASLRYEYLFGDPLRPETGDPSLDAAIVEATPTPSSTVTELRIGCREDRISRLAVVAGTLGDTVVIEAKGAESYRGVRVDENADGDVEGFTVYDVDPKTLAPISRKRD